MMMRCFVFSKLMLVVKLWILTASGAVFSQSLLNPEIHPKFDIPLPVPSKIDATGGGNWEVVMEETVQWLGLMNPEGDSLKTTVWGFGIPGSVTYPGPTFEINQGVPVNVRWLNNLPMHHLLPMDTTVHLAHPHLGIPVVVHLHGGHTESASDGLPDAWFTQGFEEKGHAFVKEEYHYDNGNEASTLWYHDHTLGITRLNVYAGLAGFYLVRDANETALRNSGILPSSNYEREIVIQDRMFTNDGALFLPSDGEFPGAPEPSAYPEFFGDFILVNGAAWPFMSVEPRKYRFRLLNGSDSRFYVLRFGDNTPFLQIGTDNGLLDKPVELHELILAPGERAEVVLDFSGMAPGTQIVCTNRGPDEPYRGLNPDGSLNNGMGGMLEPADELSTGQIMQFVVDLPLSAELNATLQPNTPLRQQPIEPLNTAGVNVRKLVLFEGEDQFGRLRPQLGIYDPGSPLNGSLLFEEETTEIIPVNTTEIWEVYNATEDAHPIHLHLASYQILNRQRYEGGAEAVGVDPLEGGTKQVLILEGLEGQPRDPEPNERGWKDTGVMLPKEVTRIAAHFDRLGGYVWHCHILSHEDHEMMRRLEVVNNVGSKEPATALVVAASLARPNPFSDQTNIMFTLWEDSALRIDILDLEGKLVTTLVDGNFTAGEHSIVWNGMDGQRQQAPPGFYIYRIGDGNTVATGRVALVR